MLQQRERGSVEARLGVLRFGLAAISAVVITVILTSVILIYTQVSKASDAVEADYTMGEYMGDVLPVALPSILIVVVAAVAIYYGYKMYLKRQETA